MSSSQPHKFSEGEKILCFHGPLIYSAKCLTLRNNPKDNTNEYWVHYDGWNKKWDECVPETRVLKYNDTNVARQMELTRYHKEADIKTKAKGTKTTKLKDIKGAENKSEGSVYDPDSRSSTPILDAKIKVKNDRKRTSPSPTDDDTSKGLKRSKPDHAVETEAQFLSKVEVKIKIPDELKPWIVDDNLNVVKKKKLVKLPAKITVDQILEQYLESKKSKSNEQALIICQNVVPGIKEYFNSMLVAKLLYKEERPQYSKINAEFSNMLPSAIYGSHHLLRLFVKLGYALAYSALNEKTMTILLAAFQDFLRFLSTRASAFFSLNNYQ